MIFDYAINIFSSVAHPHALYFILPGILLLCGFGLPLPEDIILISGGYLAHSGYIDIRIFLPLVFIGVIVGDCCVFMMGRKLGYSFFNHKFVSRFIKRDHIEKAAEVIDKYHDKIFFIARFLPGLRSAIFLTGGMLKTKFWKFFLYDLFAALLSVPLLTLAAYFGGEYIDQVLKVAKGVQIGLVLFSVVIVVFVILRVRKWILKRRAARASFEAGKAKE